MPTLFMQNINLLDFAFLDKTHGMVGESLRASIYLAGDLNQEGMLYDFGPAKKKIKKKLDELMDHRLIVPEKLKDIQIDQMKEKVKIHLPGILTYSCPKDAILLLPKETICKDTLTAYLENEILLGMPSNITSVKVVLEEETIDHPHYHYTHGLKLHDGYCQRMGHGHRSKIHIFKNGERSSSWEKHWAEKWNHRFLGSTFNLVDQDEKMYHFSYSASMGDYKLSIEKSSAELLPCETTVECLAQYLAEELGKSEEEHFFEVHAFEGIGKGAIAQWKK